MPANERGTGLRHRHWLADLAANSRLADILFDRVSKATYPMWRHNPTLNDAKFHSYPFTMAVSPRFGLALDDGIRWTV